MKSHLYVADDIQTLVDAKTLIVGLYTDGVLNVNLPHDSSITPSAATPLGMSALALMLTLSDVKEGSGTAQPSLTLPDGSQGPALNPINYEVKKNQSINLLLKFVPFLISQEGKYVLKMKIDGQEIDSSFEVRFLRA